MRKQLKPCSKSVVQTLSHPVQLLVGLGVLLASLLSVIGQSKEQSDNKAAGARPSAEDPVQLALRARAYWGKGDYTNALPLYERLAERMDLELGGDHPLQARNLVLLGTMHNARGDAARALPLLYRALAIIGKHPEANVDQNDYLIMALMQMGLACQALEKYSEATSAWQRCLEIQEKASGTDSTNCLASLKALGDLCSTQADYQSALSNYWRCMRISQNAFGFEHHNVAALWNNIAKVYEWKGDYARALSMYQQALALHIKAHGSNDVGVATILNNIAVMLLLRQDFDGARLACQLGLSIRQKALGLEHPDVITSLMTLALAHECLGRNEEAIRIYQRCLEIEEKLSVKDDIQLATLLSALAFRYRELGNFEQALPLIQRSLEINEKTLGMDHPSVADGLEALGSLYADQGKHAQGHPLLVRSLKMKAKIFGINNPSVIRSVFNLALLDVDQNDLERSLSGFQLAFVLQRGYLCNQMVVSSDADGMRLSQDLCLSAAVLHSLCGLGVRRNILQGKITGAEQLAVNKALYQEVQAASAALEASAESRKKELYASYQAVQIQLSRLPEAKLDPATRDRRRREMEADLNQLAKKLADRERLVEQATKEWHVTLTNVAASLPKAAVLVDFIEYRRYDFAAARTNHWKETCYAAYLTFPLGKDSTDLVVERVDLGEAAPINEAVALLCRRMGAGQYRARDVEPALQRLSALVYEPLAPHLRTASHLIVCPDAQLSRLPFEMLSVRAGATNRYLIEEKAVSYVSSGREVARLTERAASSKSKVQTSKPLVVGNPDFDLDLGRTSRREEAQTSILAIANPKSATNQSLLTSAATPRFRSRSFTGISFPPLPDSEKEALSVAKLLGESCTLRVGAEAREAELKAVLSPRVLHIATHGFFLSDQEFQRTNSVEHALAGTSYAVPSRRFGQTASDWENPLIRCGIALAGANHAAEITNALAEDGILTGLEASLLNLQGTELVILSACQSGAGEVKIGEGVMSLRRAFTIAGAESVLASHWNVSDRGTGLLITEFIRRWQAGAPRGKAWREAQLSLLHSEEFANPYFWAAFTLTGQWR